jgi:hypothetical protein
MGPPAKVGQGRLNAARRGSLDGPRQSRRGRWIRARPAGSWVRSPPSVTADTVFGRYGQSQLNTYSEAIIDYELHLDDCDDVNGMVLSDGSKARSESCFCPLGDPDT